LLAAALGRELPTVVVDQPLKEGVPFVGVDDEVAARKAAEHLLDLGHRRFAVVSFALSPDGREGIADPGRQEVVTFRVSRLRLRGYRTALEDAGLHWPEVPVYECPSSTRDLGRRAAEALLSSEPRPTALLALSDQLALGTVEVAKERGLSVPGDLSLVGFDDVPSAASASPPLTTVHQNHAEKGLLAGQILVSRLREEEGPSVKSLPTRLAVRGSTAPLRQR
jgi:DNA-binding LacI/PurR family transcriptional regulator